MGKPNIIYIHSHDTGRYIQPYGYAVPTPSLQRLAEEGVLFRQAFNVAPTCSPSRAGLVTGMCAHCSGMLGLAHRGFFLSDYQQHIVHTVREAGYRSTLIGVQHVAAQAQTIGYDEIVPLPSSHAEHVAPAAVEWLGQQPAEPFFLTVGFFETHREYPPAGPDEDPRYCLPPVPVPETPETRLDMAEFKASARTLDQGMGAVFDALQSNGLSENTLVICTTDHGIAFPGHKCNLTDGGIGVMLIMRGPGGFSGGKVIDAMVSHTDVFPTICELLELEPPDWLQGRSVMPLIRGEADEINDEIYADVIYHAAYEPKRCVRTRRWKYIRQFGDRQTPVLPNCDDSASKTAWLEHGWAERQIAPEKLYDLVFDPTESHNLAGDPDLQWALDDMRKRIDAWMQRTNDPLLEAFARAPWGARVNDPSGISPRETPVTV